MRDIRMSNKHIDDLARENKRLRNRLGIEREFMKHAMDISRTTYSIDEYLRAVFKHIKDAMGFSRGSIILKSQDPLDSEHFYIVIQEGIPKGVIPRELIDIDGGSGYIAEALRGSESRIVDFRQDEYRTNSIVVPFGLDHDGTQGVICVSNNRREENYTEEDRQTLVSLSRHISYGIDNITRERSHLENQVRVVEARDMYTAAHSTRVAQLARLIASEIGLSVDEQQTIQIYGNLHDIGKIAIEDGILLKEGKLTDEEYRIIQTHPPRGEEMIIGRERRSEYGISVVRNHHERYNGEGYPDQLGEKDIPLVSRILAIADAFDAMSSNRCYRTALPPDKIEKIIKEESGKQFDPELADVFLDLWPKLVYTQVREGGKQLIYHKPHCEQALLIPSNLVIATLESNIKNYGDYSPCNKCFEG